MKHLLIQHHQQIFLYVYLLKLIDYRTCALFFSELGIYRLTHLNLFALEDIADARVEGSAGEHGSDWVCQIQNLFKH